MTDVELLTRFVSDKDDFALSQIVDRYERLVWSVCRRVLLHQADVEDAFQTTFLVLAKDAHRIRRPESLSNWLYGVARRSAIRIRSRRVVSRLTDVMETANNIADNQQSALESVARQHEIDLVDQKLQAMHQRYRTPLVLKYFSGLTAKQIADQLNLSVASVESRIRRARTMLRTQLRSEGVRYDAGMLLTTCLASRSTFPIVTAKSTATFAGYVAGIKHLFNHSGVKLMICKGICAVGITTMLIVGGVFHIAEAQQSTPSSVVTVYDMQDDSSSIDDATEFVSIVADQDPEDERASDLNMSAHDHIRLLHDSVLEALHERCRLYCELVSCCCE